MVFVTEFFKAVAVTTPLSYQPVPLKEASIPWAVLTAILLIAADGQ